jgi:hypothetical protein
MTTWREFTEAAPLIATIFARRHAATGNLCLLATLRADGSPRISPCEVFVVGEDLMLGMMWQSKKALDLVRDPRIAVHSVQSERSGEPPDVKLYGVVEDVSDADARRRYGDVLDAAIGWRPPEPYHLFALDVRQAGMIAFGAGRRAMRWTEESGTAVLRHPDA